MGKLVLVVEDDRDIRENMKNFLASEGFEVQTAENGQKALDILHAGLKPAIILLDLMMPVMDGFKFREEQEKDPKIAYIPIVLMTADSQIESARFKLGIKTFIRKPFDLDALSRVLQQYKA